MFKGIDGSLRLKIHDVLDYDEWSGKGVGTLMQVCTSRLDDLLENGRLRGMRSGEVAFFLSHDKRRARVLTCLSREPKVYSIGTVSFGVYSPELVMSLWLDRRLRAVGLGNMASEVENMSAEERLHAWRKLKNRMDDVKF